jgi:hypothetical protein
MAGNYTREVLKERIICYVYHLYFASTSIMLIDLSPICFARLPLLFHAYKECDFEGGLVEGGKMYSVEMSVWGWHGIASVPFPW